MFCAKQPPFFSGSFLQNAGFSTASDAARVYVVIGIFKVLCFSMSVLNR